MNGKGTISFDQYIMQALGGETAAKSRYLREVVGAGPDMTLGQVLVHADELGIEAWLRSLPMRQLAAALGVPVTEPERRRRTKAEIRDAIQGALTNDRPMQPAEIAERSGLRPATVERHLQVLLAEGQISYVSDRGYWPVTTPATDASNGPSA